MDPNHVNSWGPNGDTASNTNGQHQQDGISSAFSKLNVNPGPPGMMPLTTTKIGQTFPPPVSQGMHMPPVQQHNAPAPMTNHVMPNPGANSNHHNMPPQNQPLVGGPPGGMNNLPPAPQPHLSGPPGMNSMPPTSQPQNMGGLNRGMPPVPSSQPSLPPGMNQANPPPAMNPGMPPLSQAPMPQHSQTMPPHSQGNMPQYSQANMPPMPPHSQSNMPPMPPHSQNNMPPPGQMGSINSDPTYGRLPGPGMPNPAGPAPTPMGGIPMNQPQPGHPGGLNGPPPGMNHGLPPQPQQAPEIPQQPPLQQQPMYGRPPGPNPGQPPAPLAQNHVQPGMPPMPRAGAPTSSLPKRYPAYPQQPPMSGPVPPTQTYPSYPQPAQPQQQPQFQQPGMPAQDGGYYAQQQQQGVPGGPQYPRPPGAIPQGGMAQPNYPQPQYGQQATQYGQGQSAPPYAQPSAQQGGQKRLDPDQLPAAIAVMQEDQQTRSGVFRTDQKGLLPPLVTTKFQVEDFGNSSPRFVRATMYSVPGQPDMLKQTAIPFALVINPFDSPAKDEQPIPCVDLGPMGPVRCIRCKAYMSPLMQFIDGGRRFQCLLCKATTEVPPEYFQHLDHTGERVDKWERPELWRGTYEYIATAEYCRNNTLPKEPAFIFVIDVSYNNVKSGLVSLLCSQMKNVIEALPTHVPVGFITYNSKVHFYNIDPALGQPQMVIVPDVADMFMPILKGFLVPRAEAMNAVDMLMEQIPVLFGDTKETEAVLGPAIVAGMEALKASDRVGKLLVFHSSLPTSDAAPGKLKNREADRKLLGTDKEKAVLVPQSTYYNGLGQDCVGAGVSVDLYLFNNSYVDVATIGQVARLTGGSVNKYTYFQADIDGPRVVGDILLHLSRPIGFDAVMRVRTSTGVRPTDFYGHFFMANTTDVELAAVDSQKGIGVEIKHDASITDEDGVYIQIALLYTTIYGQRRLRVHNVALNTCMQMADLYRNCELDAIINFMAKQSISRSVETSPQDLKEGVIKRCAQMLATYRKHCANPSMPGQLILPECLKLLPLYINCVLRSDAVAGTSEITPDDRSWLMYTVMTMGVASTVRYFYPQLIPVADSNGSIDEPAPVRCSRDKLSEDSAFILENGIYIFLWIGAGVSPEWLQSIFGVSNLGQLNVETITELPDHVNSDESLRLRAFIRSLRTERQRHMRLTIVRQRDKMELVMNRFLVEDRGTDGQPSYVDFLCHMHKEIRSFLNQ